MKNDTEFKENLKEFVSKIKNADDIYGFFRMLNYPKDIILDKSYKRKISDFEFRQDVKEKLRQIYLVMSFADNLPVYLVEAKDITSAFIRDLAKGFAEKHLSGKFLIILTSDYENIIFVSPEYEKLGAGKHKIKLSRLTLNKNDLYRTDIDILSSIVFENESSWYDVWKKWKNSFNVKKVTDEFFEDYKNIFFIIRKNIGKQRIETKQAHEFTLQFLNRIMFIYFVAKKKWLNNDPKFMRTLFKEYYVKGRSEGKFNDNSFYEKWLKVIFFEAFNNNFRGNKIFPEEVSNILMNAPYLNGGLFKENELDRLKIEIKDDLFKETFNFFEKYNFTIKEDSPLDVEVAVDPQMIGYVYESLANVSEDVYEQEEDLRGDWGIFYTPRVEVDFMCRRTLVEYLSKHTDIPKEEIYEFVFDDDKTSIKKKFSQKKYWNKIEEVFEKLSVIDPACGSGAFLVGMLNVLAELYKIIYSGLERERTDYEIKKRIVGRFLYGVDVMPWAIYAAELRLWLQLIVETEFKIEQLKKEPLLPNLNMNLRVGDSLVQEIGGLSFNLRTNTLKPHLKEGLNELKKEKQDYFDNKNTGRLGSTENMHKWGDEIRKEEVKLFHKIIDDRIESLKMDIDTLNISLSGRKQKQRGLNGEPRMEIEIDINQRKDRQKTEENINKCEEEIKNLKKLKAELDKPEKKLFIWDIDFAEIFGDKGGFDIVIGNPPYVRQEKISPPNKPKDEATLEDRKEYKEKLIKSVQNRFPAVESINRQSDYYIYFYFHGLSLLNEKGTFCFITSNSWLDVGYGKELQEFLLKYAPIYAIYDNPKRSFAHADVNTIIALFGAPKFKEEKIIGGVKISNGNGWPMLNNTAKFVMFKKPFEEVLNSKNLIDIENIKIEKRGLGITELVKNVVKTNDYRVFPILQEDLLEDGWEYPEDYKNGRFKAGSYESNKWGGKYLRAPDIFYTILEKGKGKLVKLGDIAKVRFGIKTGANEFFYLDEEAQKKWNIEKEFLKPVIKGPRECSSVFINPKQLKFKIFLCHKPKSELKNTTALKYIEYGEKNRIDKTPSVQGRNRWYDIQEPQISDYLWTMTYRERFFVLVNGVVLADARFYDIYSKVKDKIKLGLVLNSTLALFYIELMSRTYGGGGGPVDVKVYEVEKMIILDSQLISDKFKSSNILKREVNTIFTECGFDDTKPIREQEPNPLPDRAELDKIVFDELGLTKEERKEVYWAVCELVKQRLEKARSLRED
ncbi:hypothetical protein D4Q76_02070 [archaeon]|nr:MAG: hypothetical protein D4Q76_02070 [archaeon]